MRCVFPTDCLKVLRSQTNQINPGAHAATARGTAGHVQVTWSVFSVTNVGYVSDSGWNCCNLFSSNAFTKRILHNRPQMSVNEFRPSLPLTGLRAARTLRAMLFINSWKNESFTQSGTEFSVYHGISGRGLSWCHVL